MRTKDIKIRQYVGETFGPDAEVPGYDTLRRVWRDWFGPGGARQRYARSAQLPEKNGHVVVHRPGQVVALDSTVLPVMTREGVFGEPVKPHLTLALDVFTHSLVAFRLTLVSDASVDVAMLLRDVMMPLPMRDDWGEDLEWPYPGLPAAVVAEFAGSQRHDRDATVRYRVALHARADEDRPAVHASEGRVPQGRDRPDDVAETRNSPTRSRPS